MTAKKIISMDINKVFYNIFEMSKVATEECSSASRGILLPLCFIAMLLSSIFIFPFLVIHKIFVKEKEAPYKKLKMDLENKWHLESAEGKRGYRGRA